MYGLLNHAISFSSLSDHPLTQLLYKYQHATYCKLGPLVEKYAHKPSVAKQKELKTQDSQSSKTEASSSVVHKQEESDTNSDATLEDSINKAIDNNSTGFSSETSDLGSSGEHKQDDNEDDPFDEVTQDELHRLEVEALQRHLRNIVADVHAYLEQLINMFTVAYKPLASASGKDICYSALEEPFFKPIWGYLLALFR